MANIISAISDNLPIIISVIFVFIFTAKNFGIKLSLIFILSILLQIFVIYKLSSKLINASKDTNNHRNDLLNEAQDMNINIDSILSNGSMVKERNKLKDLVKEYKSKLDISFNNRFKIQAYDILINYAYIIFALYFLKNNFSAPLVISYLLMNIALNQSFIFKVDQFVLILFFYGRLVDGISNINDYSTYKKEKLDEKQEDLEKEKEINKGVILLENVSFSYDKRTIQNSIDIPKLKLDFDKIIILKGSIGSGKSTLLKIIFGFIDVDKGNISYNDKILNNKREWRKNIHYTPQRPELFNRSIVENIFYPKKNGTIKDFKIIKEIGLMNLYNDIIKKTNNMGFGGEKLSGGQRQIINLFRSILSEKQIILLDEPTSSLDSINRKIIYKMIKGMKKLKKTIIISTHDPELINIGHKIITLQKGKIIDIINKKNK